MKSPNCMQTGTLLESLPTRGSKKERGWFRLMLKERHPPRPQHPNESLWNSGGGGRYISVKFPANQDGNYCQYFIHMKVDCPIGSDIRLALFENLGPHIYRQFGGTNISLHVERTLPYPYQSLWQKHKWQTTNQFCWQWLLFLYSYANRKSHWVWHEIGTLRKS